jgi:dihydroorotate dehydrogenase (fumarate)
VLKSLFEEQILFESRQLTGEYAYPEAADYIRGYSKSHSVGEYLDLISESRKRISQPVFASINCISGADWTDFARQTEEAGANAIELNMFLLPLDAGDPVRIEESYLEIVRKVRQAVSIPLVVKISPHFTNLLHMVSRFYAMGVQGVVLFNRLYEPDIDLKNMKITSSEVFSSPSDLRHSLRWISLISDRFRKIDISGSTGIHDGEAAIKVLLAGAKTAQVCSAIYMHGPEHIGTMLGDISKWMDAQEYQEVDDFCGMMSYRNYDDPATWERAQFMRYFSSRH